MKKLFSSLSLLTFGLMVLFISQGVASVQTAPEGEPGEFIGQELQPGLSLSEKPFSNFFKKFHWFLKKVKKASKYEDVATWKPIGLRFAAGYDAHGKLLAIYDLSFPTLGNVINLGRISKDVMSGEAFKKGLALAEQVALKDTRHSPAAIKRAIKNLKDISPLMDAGKIFSEKWWKSVHWKNHLTNLSDEAPNRFQLSDIEVSADGIPSAFVNAMKKVFQAALKDTNAPGIGPDRSEMPTLSDQDVLSMFTWVKSADGYEIQWNNTLSNSSVSRPRKLIDLLETRTILLQNLEIGILWEGLTTALEYIPVPVLQALISTSVARFQHYTELTRIEHFETLIELLASTDEGSLPTSPFSTFSQDELNSTIEAAQYGVDNWTSSWEWLLKYPLADWQKKKAQDALCSQKAHDWLKAQGQTDIPFNSRFTIGTDSQHHSRLYLTSEVCVKKGREPVVSIDYAAPEIERLSRVFLEVFSAGIDFSTRLIPTVGGLVSGAYDFLIEGPYEGTRLWEARLMSHLEERQLSGESGQWDKEIAILQSQRVDPFEIDRATMLELIRERRHEMRMTSEF